MVFDLQAPLSKIAQATLSKRTYKELTLSFNLYRNVYNFIKVLNIKTGSIPVRTFGLNGVEDGV